MKKKVGLFLVLFVLGGLYSAIAEDKVGHFPKTIATNDFFEIKEVVLNRVYSVVARKAYETRMDNAITRLSYGDSLDMGLAALGEKFEIENVIAIQDCETVLSISGYTNFRSRSFTRQMRVIVRTKAVK